jgi:hypothetical protein
MFLAALALTTTFGAMKVSAQGLPAKRSAGGVRTPVGSLQGQFRVTGGPHEPKKLVIDKEKRRDYLEGPQHDVRALAHYAKLGLKDPSFLVSAQGGLKNVVVWISDKKLPIPPEPVVRRLPAPATLEFKNGLFQPRVLALESWRTIRLVNADPFAVNFRWSPLPRDSFHQLLAQDDHVDVKVLPQRLPSKVQSENFPWADAWLFPVEHPYFAVTDADGKFRIDRIPVGEWEFSIWHERFGYVQSSERPRGRFTMQINAGENELKTVEISLPERPEPAPKEDLTELRNSRRKMNERGNASEFTGLWQMTLPAGFRYDVKISQDKEAGTLAMDCEHRALVLLGEFAMQEGELRLVEPRNDKSTQDLIWTYRDGIFELTKEVHGTGARYLGAKLERKR